MDIGLGNGMRNKLAEATAKGDHSLANEYVSTTYVMFSVVMFVIFLIFAVLNVFLNWNHILKSNIGSNQLLFITYIIVLSFCLRLVLSLATTVVVALQKVYVDSLINFLINFFTVVGVYLLPKFYSPSFTIFSITLAIIPVMVLFLFNIILFKATSFKYIRPRLKFFNMQHVKGLLNVGVQFFFIQFIGIIIFSTDNILITQFFSSADVTAFNVAYKYYYITVIVFSIILLPYWSAFTASYAKGEFEWIKKAFKKLLSFWVIQVLIIIFLIAVSKPAFHLWVGNKLSIPLSLSLSLGLYTMIVNWNNIFAYFINGVSKIRLQLFSSFFAGILNIPLSFVLAKYTNLGVSAIVIANAFCLFISSVWSPIQCYKLIYNKASGIWNK
jgi:O-antigen/teichoic acid export membrane protein